MNTDASSLVDQVITSGDPLTALLDASSPADRLALLPAAVRRAAELAEKMRLGIQLRSGSTDPLLIALVAAMTPAGGCARALRRHLVGQVHAQRRRPGSAEQRRGHPESHARHLVRRRHRHHATRLTSTPS